MKLWKFCKGVTLVELMVVVAIIAVIGGVAYPAYVTQVQKANRMDAKRILMQIQIAYERYYIENSNQYNGVVSATFSALSLTAPPSSNFYTFTCNACTSTSYTLVASAQGNQTADTTCTNFYLTNTGVRTATGSACW